MTTKRILVTEETMRVKMLQTVWTQSEPENLGSKFNVFYQLIQYLL